MYRRGGLFFGVLKSCEVSTAESLAKTFSRRPLGDESGLEDVEFIILEISMLLCTGLGLVLFFFKVF